MIKYLHTKLDIDHIKTKKINKSKEIFFIALVELLENINQAINEIDI